MPQVYIADERPGMSPAEKNDQLSAALTMAPNRNRDITSIRRGDPGESGWWISYK